MLSETFFKLLIENLYAYVLKIHMWQNLDFSIFEPVNKIKNYISLAP